MRILMAQINPHVGAIEDNAEKIQHIMSTHQTHDVIVFPELVLTGYPPEDLLFRPAFKTRVERALASIAQHTQKTYIIIGHPSWDEEKIYNSASVLYQGQVLAVYHKQKLPNDGVFDEQRYFTQGSATLTFNVQGHVCGVCICEDLWQKGPVEESIEKGVEILFCINASPFDEHKPQKRERLLQHYATQGINIIYVNQVGGQDELVFDGQSLAFDAQGSLRARAAAFQEELLTLTYHPSNTLLSTITPSLSPEALLYQALVCGLRDYVDKNHFAGVLLGLSGGIDSALTLALAVDALGASRVHAVMMPSCYTQSISVEDAWTQIHAMNVQYTFLPLEQAFESMMQTLSHAFSSYAPDITEENLQARLRGMLLMALSNKTGYMVLTTSNKSETAVGYTTLYGDMCGGFGVLKDVLKTCVYALANYRNSVLPVIPQRVITRPPSAELADNQTDQDSLPDYETLDAIIQLYMEKRFDVDDIVDQGYARDIVCHVLHLIKRNEYKRRQAAPGVKISPVAFGKDWRYPITSC